MYPLTFDAVYPWLNNAIIKLNFIIMWYCFVIFCNILALLDIILVTFVTKHHMLHDMESSFETHPSHWIAYKLFFQFPFESF